MKRKIYFMSRPLVFLLVFALASPMAALCQDKKIYKFKFAWNDIWGPKFRASQIYRPGGEMQRMLYERSNGRIQLEIISRMFPTEDLFSAVAKGKADVVLISGKGHECYQIIGNRRLFFDDRQQAKEQLNTARQAA